MMPNLDRTLLPEFHRTSESVRRELPPGMLSEYPMLVGRVYGNPAVPTNSNVFVSINPVDVLGTDTEGSVGILTVDGTRSLLVYLVGSKPAVAGDFVICRFLGNRWVAERLGKSISGISLPGCPCASVPTTLTMTASKPTSNNRIFQNATFVYAAPPSSLATARST